MANRYKAEYQGTAQILWNVIDTSNSTYVKRLMMETQAKRLAREMNKKDVRTFFYFLADFGEFLLSFPHPKDFCRKPFEFWGRPR